MFHHQAIMNVTFGKAKQNQTDTKKDPVICTLCEAKEPSMQKYSTEEQTSLKAMQIDMWICKNYS